MGPATGNSEKSVNLGKAAHICAAAKGGPRFAPAQTPDERSSVDNGVYLCGACADLIDKDNGAGFPAETLHDWKRTHEAWIRERINKGELDATKIEQVVWQDIGSAVTAIGNAQTVVINQGLSHSDACQIANEVFENNFLRMADRAAETALDRAKEFTESFVATMLEQDVSLDAMSEPATQNSLFTAQKAYALNGEKGHLDILSDILSERCKAPRSGFVEISMDGAIDACSKLTPTMISTLSLVVAVRYRLAGSNGQTTLPQYLRTHVVSLRDFANTKAECELLDTAGCLRVATGMVNKQTIQHAFKELYPEVFKTLPDQEEPTIRKQLVAWAPELELIMNKWDKSVLPHSSITPTGLAIALANLKRVTGESFDLSRWIYAE